jgi:hypothetical protein
MAVQQGRSERRGESYSAPYGEPLSDARTLLADFFSILLDTNAINHQHGRLTLPGSVGDRDLTYDRRLSSRREWEM